MLLLRAVAGWGKLGLPEGFAGYGKRIPIASLWLRPLLGPLNYGDKTE